jgi:hypothetical protein
VHVPNDEFGRRQSIGRQGWHRLNQTGREGGNEYMVEPRSASRGPVVLRAASGAGKP